MPPAPRPRYLYPPWNTIFITPPVLPPCPWAQNPTGVLTLLTYGYGIKLIKRDFQEQDIIVAIRDPGSLVAIR